MKKIYKLIIILAIFIFCILCILCLTKYKLMPYSISGTYSAGNEPSMDNIYVVMHRDEFTIYNQKQSLETGTYEKLELDIKSDIYKLVSDEDITIGYVVYKNNNIALLNFMDNDITLEKISKDAAYLGYSQ